MLRHSKTSMPDQLCPECGAPLPPDGVCSACPVGTAVGEADQGTTHTAVSTVLGRPAQIGPYKILDTLGEGGMGVVYLAEQEKPFRRRVAMKIIKIGMDTREVIGRFEAERQALALMEHPNIAQVHDAGATEDGRPYFVMEHVPGVPITEYCDKHRLSTRARLELFVHVCSAVHHAHQKGIIHRDIKPSNILVMVQDGRPLPKVIDFGVAKATHQRLTEKTVFTQLGLLIGTPEYMSPEQAEMGGLNVDTTTDIYSLGVVLYELLAGALPFDAFRLRQAGYGEIQRIIRDEEPPRPSTRLSGLGAGAAEVAHRRHTEASTLERELRGDLDWITLKAMGKDRTHRYASASEFAADVRRHLNREVVIARPPSLSYRINKFVARHRVAVVGSIAMLVVLIATVLLSGAMYMRAAASRDLAERQSYIAAISAADAQLLAANSSTYSRRSAADEALRRLVETPSGRRNWEWHFLSARLDSSEGVLWGATSVVQYRGDLAVSSDQSQVFWSATEGLHGWDLIRRRWMGAWPTQGAVAAVARDASLVLSGGSGPGRWRVFRRHDGEVISQLALTSPQVQVAAFSTDTKRLVTLASDGTMQSWLTASGELVSVGRVTERVKSIQVAPDGQVFLVRETGASVWQSHNIALQERLHRPGSTVGADVSWDGGYIVRLDTTGAIFRSLTTDESVEELIGRHPGATVVALSLSGRFAATGGSDGTVRTWAASPNKTRFPFPSRTDSEPLATLDAYDEQPIHALAFMKDESYLIAASRRGLLRKWRRWPRRLTGVMASLPLGPTLALTDDGRYMVGPPLRLPLPGVPERPEEELYRIDLETEGDPELLGTLPLGRPTSVIVSPDASRVLTAARNGTFQLWTRESNAFTSLGRYGPRISAIAISRQGTWGAAAWSREESVQATGREFVSSPGSVHAFNLGTGEEMFERQVESVSRLHIAPDADRLFIIPAPAVSRLGSDVNTQANCPYAVQAWSVRRRVLEFEIPECPAHIAFADNGPRIVTQSATDGKIRVWHGTNGKLVSVGEDVFASLSGLAVSPDATRFAARTSDAIGVFETETGALLLTIRAAGGPAGLTKFSWTSDGLRLIECGPFGVVRVWDARHNFDPAAKALAQRMMGKTGVFGQSSLLATEAVAMTDSTVPPELHAAVISEIEALGDRDIAAILSASRNVTVQAGRSAGEYQRAVRMAEIVVRRVPWTAYHHGVLGLARYRIADYAGSLASLTRAEQLRSRLLVDETIFKAMALYRLGRTDEAAATVREVTIDPNDGELRVLMNELQSLSGSERLRHPASTTGR